MSELIAESTGYLERIAAALERIADALEPQEHDSDSSDEQRNIADMIDDIRSSVNAALIS